MKLLRRDTGKILVESHRGAEHLAPENSWAAILAGAEAGAELIEVDVQVTSDGVPVLYHPYRLPNKALVRAAASGALAELDAGDGKAPPLLADVLSWLQEQSVGLVLDVKNGFGGGVAPFATIIEMVQQAGVAERVLLASWDHLGLLWAKRHLPAISTRALLRGSLIDLVAAIHRAEVDAVSLSYDLIEQADVEAFHEAGIAVVLTGLWEPNFRYPVELGVDAVSWGDPAEAIFALQSLGAR